MKTVVLKVRLWSLLATGILFTASHDNAAEAKRTPPATPSVNNELVSSAEVSAWVKKLQDTFLPELKGDGTARAPDDISSAVECFTEGAKWGDAWANVGLGWLYARGWGVPQNQTRSFECFNEAALAGNMIGQFNVAMGYDDGKGVPQDSLEATTWYRKAAEQGYVYAQMLLGSRYENGKGVSQDYAEAAKWYRKAADQDDSFSEFQLGIFYSTGQGVERNEAESFKWMRKAADHIETGQPTAMANVGKAYHYGRGVAQDYTEAAKWYRKAADRGDAIAQLNLGVLYANGQGVPQDYAESGRLYRRAAAQGNATAQFNLAERYRVGEGVGQDAIEAYAFYNLAASAGYEEARKMRDAVAMAYLKGDTLLIAQKRSRELKGELDTEKAKAANPGQNTNTSSGGSPAPAASAESAPFEAKGMGSGFAVAEGGLVVTNWHVVEKAARIELVTARGRTAAKVVAADQSNDLAILRAAKSLAAALPIRSSRGAKIGTEVFTIGFPNPDLQGFSPKFNRGEISSVAGAADDPRYFQISVPVQPGNSGGALCDAEGRVIGVVAAKLDERLAFKTSGSLPENVNYAIKSTYLLALLESLELPQNALAADDKGPVSPEAARQRAQNSAVLVLVY